ncbi:MAG: guanylate kinase [candidate division Zixibacteria bacterium]|nr:guanylate kinase [candidate division Zixibacteria bacterium]
MTRTKPGKIVIISSPSGGGKTSICRRLLSRTRKAAGWQFSVSYTTRDRRRGEKHGQQYYFVSPEEFDRKARWDFFAEHFRVHLYRYGTPRKPLEAVLKSGGVMILDVDVKGAKRLNKVYPDAITIFILPPSIKILRRRLTRRGTETSRQLKVRFENAKKEMRLYKKFEYAVINDNLDQATREVLSIIESHHCRVEKLKPEQIKQILG